MKKYYRQSTWKSIVSFLLLIAISVGLTACGQNNQKEEEAAAQAEPTHLVWWVYEENSPPKAADEVLKRVNELAAEKIGVTVEMRFMNEEQFAQAMNSGEYYDMTFTCNWCNDFDGNARAGKFYNITNLVKTETPALYEAVDPWWKIGTLGERIYGVPMLKDLGAEVFFRLNSDYFEGEKGLTIPEEMKFEDLEPMLEMWKADHPDEYPLYMTQGGLSGASSAPTWSSPTARRARRRAPRSFPSGRTRST